MMVPVVVRPRASSVSHPKISSAFRFQPVMTPPESAVTAALGEVSMMTCSLCCDSLSVSMTRSWTSASRRAAAYNPIVPANSAAHGRKSRACPAYQKPSYRERTKRNTMASTATNTRPMTALLAIRRSGRRPQRYAAAATAAPDEGGRRGQHEDHGGGGDHGQGQRRHGPGQRQGAVGPQGGKNGDQQEDGHAQQNQQAATVDSAQARHRPIAGGGQHRRNRHARNMHGTPGKRS